MRIKCQGVEGDAEFLAWNVCPVNNSESYIIVKLRSGQICEWRLVLCSVVEEPTAEERGRCDVTAPNSSSDAITPTCPNCIATGCPHRGTNPRVCYKMEPA